MSAAGLFFMRIVLLLFFKVSFDSILHESISISHDIHGGFRKNQFVDVMENDHHN